MAKERNSSWQEIFWKVAGVVSAVWDWYERLPTLFRGAVKLIGAGTLTGAMEGVARVIWGNLPWPMPTTFVGWVWHVGLLVLVGLGLLHIVDSVPEAVNQLLAPRRFRELPVSLKNKVLEVHEDPPVRTSRTTAWYKDLHGMGLIRDTASLASNQAMVRPTAVGTRLAEEWKEEVAQRSKEHSVDRTGVGELQKLHPDFQEAVDRGNRLLKQMLRNLSNLCEGQQQYCPEFFVSEFVRERVLDELRERMSTYESHLNNQHSSAIKAQNAFICAYKKYVSVRNWIERLDGMLEGAPLHERTGFVEWCKRDQEFDRQLRRYVAQEELERLRRWLGRISMRHGASFDCEERPST